MPEAQPQDSLAPQDARDLRSGMRVSLLSIAWTLVASAVSITVGVRAGSLVLVAFGCTGFLDAAGSIALVVHFRHALKHEAFSEAHERVAFLVVNTGLVVVAVSTVAGSVGRLLARAHGHESTVGMVVAGASIVVLGVLARRKIILGRAIPSQALVADGILSSTGAVLAVVTVVGTLLSALGWWWADPVAALVVAAGAFWVAVALARQ
ncbi:MAG TPA: cation transporter [Nocardioides sp.]|nr:cation transporter [Nocardioides sp.]